MTTIFLFILGFGVGFCCCEAKHIWRQYKKYERRYKIMKRRTSDIEKMMRDDCRYSRDKKNIPLKPVLIFRYNNMFYTPKESYNRGKRMIRQEIKQQYFDWMYQLITENQTVWKESYNNKFRDHDYLIDVFLYYYRNRINNENR